MSSSTPLPHTESARSQSSCTISVENIEKMRQREGINDCELRDEISRLKVGDVVHITLLADRGTAEDVLIRITSINKLRFTGMLAKPAVNTRLQQSTDGMTLYFNADHIHSIHQSAAAKPRDIA